MKSTVVDLNQGAFFSEEGKPPGGACVVRERPIGRLSAAPPQAHKPATLATRAKRAVIASVSPCPSTAAAPAGASGSAPSTTLTGASELVILAVTAQQAEVIKFAQIDGQITLVLRSPKDFRDQSGAPIVPPADTTSGVVLKTLIDQYGVLPPQVIAAIPSGSAPRRL